jgi:pilus assembly protein Flp/PilA
VVADGKDGGKNALILGIHFYDWFKACAYSLSMLRKLRTFLADDSGATAIEYGLIAAGISVAIIATVKGLGTKLNSTFSSISTQLK